MRISFARAFLLASVAAMLPIHLHASQLPDRHHVVVLLDRSESMTAEGRTPAVRAALYRELERLCRSSRVLPDNAERALFDPTRGDRLSILAFGLNYKTAENFDGFITTREPWGALRQAEAAPAVLGGLWSRLDGNDPVRFFSANWSGISLAMPLALAYLGEHGGADAERVGRTFLVLVTDNEFNGVEPSLELGRLQHDMDDLRGDYPSAPRLIEATRRVQERVDSARMYYLFRPIRQVEVSGPGKSVYLAAFEAVPNTWAFAIESVWGFERTFRLHRTPGGFASSFRLRPLGARLMHPQRVEAVLLRGRRELDRVVADTPRAPELRLSLPAGARRDSLTVRLRFWVRYDDPVYGMHLLDPDGSELQGRAGLERILPVELEGPARVMGVVPLPFWAYRLAARFGLTSQRAAALAYTLVLLALLGFTAWFGIRKASTNTDATTLVLKSAGPLPSRSANP